MNKDFHYYGTYYAARIAGYEHDDAAQIALFAQCVDECTKTKVTGQMPSGNIGEGSVTPVYTVQSTGGLQNKYGMDFAKFTKEDLELIAGVWCPFHFLPGGVVPERFDRLADKREIAKLICRPNSSLVEKMVRNLLASEEPDCGHIGLVMHVLADTWAHRNFAGIPAWYLNDAERTVTGGDGKKISFNWLLEDNIEAGRFRCTPPSPRDNSVVYLGHVRMGHVPDLGYMVYTYQPVWSSQKITVNKKDDFARAFAQMVYVMQCLRQRRRFDLTEFQGCGIENVADDSTAQAIMSNVLVTLAGKKTEQGVCKDMADLVKQDYSDITLLPFPDDFLNLGNGVIGKFFEAAKQHREMVMKECRDQLEAYYRECEL